MANNSNSEILNENVNSVKNENLNYEKEKNDENINPGYFAIIPGNIRYDKTLCPNAKLLYGEITSLCNKKGHCWASNSYFSKLYNVAERTIQRWINQLVDKKYVYSTVENKNKRFLSLNPIEKKSLLFSETKVTGGMTKLSGGYDKNVTHNNKSNNKDKDIYSLSSNESKEYISLGQIQKKQNLAVKNKTKKENKKAISSIENDLEKEFLESFWNLYPKKEHKIDAKKAFFKARKTGSKLETIVQGLKNYIAYWQNDNRPKKYIPHAATWLNGKMWVDDCLKQETHTSYDINEYVKTMDTFDCNYIKPNRPAQNTDEYLDKLLDGCFIKKSESNDESQVEDHIQFLDSS